MERTYIVHTMSRCPGGTTAALATVMERETPDGSKYADVATGDPEEGVSLNDQGGVVNLIGVPDSCRPGDLVHVTVIVEAVDQ